MNRKNEGKFARKGGTHSFRFMVMVVFFRLTSFTIAWFNKLLMTGSYVFLTKVQLVVLFLSFFHHRIHMSVGTNRHSSLWCEFSEWELT